MVDRSAEELAEAAEGNVKKKHLVKTSGMIFTPMFDKPMINYVNDGEQPEYIFQNGRGYNITEQNGNDSTPHAGGGDKYLVVTDQRLLLVADYKEGDETLEHTYDEIVDIGSLDVTTSNIQFKSSNNKTYMFTIPKYNDQVINEAVDYISERIETSNEISNRFEGKFDTLRSELDEIDALDKKESIDEVEARLNEINEKLESTKQEAIQYDFVDLSDDLADIDERKENLLDDVSEIQLEQRRQDIRDEIETIYSEIDEIDTLVEEESLEEAEMRAEEIKSEIKPLESTIDNQESESFEVFRDDLTQLKQERENLLDEISKIQLERRHQKIKNGNDSISSYIDEANTLIERGSLDKAEEIAEKIESEIKSIRTAVNNQESETFGDIQDDLTRFSQQREDIVEEISRIRRDQQRQNLENEVDDLRSRLNDADTLTEQGSLDEAQANLDEIDSSIASVQSRAKQHGFGTLRDKADKIESRREKMLEKVTDLIESNTIQRLAEGSVQTDQYSKQSIITQLREMDPYAFEELVAKIWQTQGWDAEATSGSTDRGVDVVAVKKDAFEKRRHLIQVKRHGKNSTVGSEDIQKYASLYQRDEQVDNVFIVTSNRFTKEAKEVAEGRDVSLVNVDELYDMLIST
jgi:HJR/Mrr/RecB family endonuclease/soluble cytochrome b562